MFSGTQHPSVSPDAIPCIMRRTVVLRHIQEGLPDHFDWLIDQPERDEEHRLITFKCDQFPTQAQRLIATKSPDHRAIYLDYEGDIGQGRGQVVRVLQGYVLEFSMTHDTLRCDVDWHGNGRVSYQGRYIDSHWLITITP